VCVGRRLATGACPALQAGASDGQLLSRDFGNFHDAHRVVFLKYARFRGLSYFDAEDVVHEAFVTLYRKRERLWQSDNHEAFAFTVLRNAIVDYFRWKDRQPVATGTVDDLLYCEPVSDEVDRLILQLDLRRELDRLPDRQADCMRLHALLDQDTDTVARYLGISQSAVTSNLSHARKGLRHRRTTEAEEGTP